MIIRWDSTKKPICFGAGEEGLGYDTPINDRRFYRMEKAQA